MLWLFHLLFQITITINCLDPWLLTGNPGLWLVSCENPALWLVAWFPAVWRWNPRSECLPDTTLHQIVLLSLLQSLLFNVSSCGSVWWKVTSYIHFQDTSAAPWSWCKISGGVMIHLPHTTVISNCDVVTVLCYNNHKVCLSYND